MKTNPMQNEQQEPKATEAVVRANKYRLGRHTGRVILTVNGEEQIAQFYDKSLAQPVTDFLNGHYQNLQTLLTEKNERIKELEEHNEAIIHGRNKLSKVTNSIWNEKQRLQAQNKSLIEANRWVPVEERLPQSEILNYQIACNDDVYTMPCTWDNAKQMFFTIDDGTIFELYEVTHYRELNTDGPDWLPLPKFKTQE